MLLYHAPSSYYSMIARLALNEAQVPYESQKMDIHLAKEQLSPWYLAINPHMTVPTGVQADRVLCDSRDILRFAAEQAHDMWMDSDQTRQADIDLIVQQFYAIPIERLTFVKAMTRFAPLRVVFPRLLARIIKNLQAELLRCDNPHIAQAIRQKIHVNEDRIAYFKQGRLIDKLDQERGHITAFLTQLKLGRSDTFLLGSRISSADIVVAVLVGRLYMLGETSLLSVNPAIEAWFERMQARPAFIKSDIWVRFQPWRIAFRQ